MPAVDRSMGYVSPIGQRERIGKRFERHWRSLDREPESILKMENRFRPDGIVPHRIWTSFWHLKHTELSFVTDAILTIDFQNLLSAQLQAQKRFLCLVL